MRDILLGRPGFDIDVAVVGDVGDAAAELARRLGGRATVHGRFGTAVVSYGDQEHVDLATARTETYAAPGALPTVAAAASIEDDLRRRDLTINALAVALTSASRGELVDPCGGRTDLGDGVIRVLHERSFIDDPTRLFRAVQYESRLGFELASATAELARAAVAAGVVQLLSGPRIREELVTMLGEAAAPASLRRMHELGLDAALDPRADAARAAGPLTRALELNDTLGAGAPAWRIALELMFWEAGAADWLATLSLRRRDAELVAGAVLHAHVLRERLAEPELSPAEVAALAERYAPDAALLALAHRDVPRLRDYFLCLRNVRVHVTGSDLAELGLSESPRVGEVLAELRRRTLNGELAGRDAELAAARDLIENP